MGDFFGIILGIIFTIFLFMVISKALNTSIGYRNKGAFVEPDDLDKVYRSSRKLIDKNYKEFKEIEEKSLEEYNRFKRKYWNLINQRYNELQRLEQIGLDENTIDGLLREKYFSDIFDLHWKMKTIVEDFEKLTGKKLKVDK